MCSYAADLFAHLFLLITAWLSLFSRVVSHHLCHRVLKSQFLSLATNQRHLVQLLQKQMQLEEAFTTTKATISVQSLNHQVSVAAPTLPDLQSEEAGSWRNGPQTRAALQFFSKKKGKNALIQRGANDDGGGLRQLVQSGVLPKGSDLHLTLKVTFISEELPLTRPETFNCDESK